MAGLPGQQFRLDARNVRMTRTGFDRFELDPRDGKGPGLRFRREGLRWMLVGVGLPDAP